MITDALLALGGARRHAAAIALLGLLLLAAPPAGAQFPAGGQVIAPRSHHLGREPLPEPWPDAPARPEAPRLDVAFITRPNPAEWVLAVRQHDVSEGGRILLNDREIATLTNNDRAGVYYYTVPAGALREGANALAIVPNRTRDNMLIGPVHLYERSRADLLGLAPVTISVVDADNGAPVPARLTITDPDNRRVEVFGRPTAPAAVRLGIVYTMGTPTTFELPAGRYSIFATRGMEWSRAESTLEVARGRPLSATLRIRREVDTTGFIAADTHLHTFTHSGHGDATVEERVVTLAGEGVELAIATDHNHNTDYRPAQQALALGAYFTTVIGNEVSTPVGHMNGFPLDPKQERPVHTLQDWVQLADGIRAKGAKVITLNHPRGLLLARYAFNQFPVNRGSGEFPNTEHFPFDAMELTNPQGKFSALFLLQDWFALLNYGRKVTAVSASDTHTLTDPAGWWRSYITSATDDPAKIDVSDACNRIVAGETSASLGIFADVRVDGRYTMGQTCSPASQTVKIRVRVAAPAWVTPRRAIVFVNGQQVAEQPVRKKANSPTDEWLEFSIKRPRHDAHLVCAVLGDGIDHPTLPPNPKHTVFTYAVTNPVFLDCDGDGVYSSPRATARVLLSRAGRSLDEQWATIVAEDDVIAVQMASLLRRELPAHQRPELEERIRQASAKRPLLAEYARTL